MHLILTGATGLVGSGVLDAMLNTKEITKISILTRNPVRMAEDRRDPRVNVIMHQDYKVYPQEVLSQLKGATGCVWALGISQTKVGAEEYVKITKDFALEAAKAFQTLPPAGEQPFNFVYVSGAGATTSPGRFSAIFARIKGETEIALAEMRKTNALLHTISVRPAFIDEVNHPAIKAYLQPRPLFERVARAAGPLFRTLAPSFCSPTEYLGRFMTELAMGQHQNQLVATTRGDIHMIGTMPVLENTAFRRLAGL